MTALCNSWNGSAIFVWVITKVEERYHFTAKKSTFEASLFDNWTKETYLTTFASAVGPSYILSYID